MQYHPENTRVALVAPNPDITALAMEIAADCQKQGVALEVFEAEGAEAARQLKIEADTVVSCGLVGQALKHSLPDHIAYVEIKTTGYDLLSAIYEAIKDRSNPTPYAIVGSADTVRAAQKVIRLLGVPLEAQAVASEAEASEYLASSCMHGERTVISSPEIVTLAKTNNIPAVVIKPGPEALMDAIESAAALARTALRERMATRQLRLLLNVMGEGLLMLNKSGSIIEANTRAAQLLMNEGGSAQAMLGMQAATALPNAGGKPFLSDILPIREKFGVANMENGNTLLINFSPLLAGGMAQGGLVSIQEAARLRALEGNIRAALHSTKSEARHTFADFKGDSLIFAQCLEKARRYAAAGSNVLLYGENGTGKDMLAQAMHQAGPRSAKPFITVNCAAFSEADLLKLLFGYAGGGIAGGSAEGRQGIFELAHEGTLFLNEVSELAQSIQGRLLRTLQDGEVTRLGQDMATPVDVRVIASSSKGLTSLAEEGKFRGDLLYRLNVFALTVPPLRERKEDIAPLAEHFLKLACEKSAQSPPEFSVDAIELITGHAWPGNIRELRNFCERLSVLSSRKVISVRDVRDALDMEPAAPQKQPAPQGPEAQPVPEALPQSAPPQYYAAPVMPRYAAPQYAQPQYAQQPDLPQGATVRDAEMRAILDALERNAWHKGRAAKELGISRSTLWRKLVAAGLGGAGE